MNDKLGDLMIVVIAGCFLAILFLTNCVASTASGKAQQGALNVQATKVDKPTNAPAISGDGPVSGSGNQGVLGNELVKLAIIVVVWDTIRDIGKALIRRRANGS